jgi:hypothetical protein
MTKRAVSSLFALASILVGCGSNPDPSMDGGRVDPADGAVVSDSLVGGGPTYTADVRPILVRRCTACHVAGGVAPFALTTYELASSLAGRLAEVTRARTMPPFLADNSGDCQTFRDARWLDESEIATFEAWAAAGAPMGDPSIAPPDPVPLPTLETVTHTLDAGVTYAPTAIDETRCYLVDPALTTDLFLTAFELHPGEPRIVHHSIVYALADAAAVDEARAADAADAGPGWTCSVAMGANSPVLVWVPGNGATTYPDGNGVRVPAGRPLVLQIHYNTLAAPGLSDHTTVDLTLSPAATREMLLYPVADLDMELAPRMSSVQTSTSIRVPGPPSSTVQVWGAMAHMHQFARSQRVVLDPGAGSECLLDIGQYDYQWQLAYFYERPVTLRGGQTVETTCGYDTMSSDQTIRWGETTQDEMCLTFLYVTR